MQWHAKPLLVLAVLGLTGGVCALPAGFGRPDTASDTPRDFADPNPLAEALTQAALTLPASPPTQVAPTLTPTPIPTPVTFTRIAESSEVFGAARVVTTIETTFYALVGETAEELDVYMRLTGPLDSVGNRFFAITKPGFGWDYNCTCDDGGCVTGPITIFVSVEYTLPVWDPPATADAELVSRWQAFQRAIERHEQGHGERASECGRQLGEAFTGLPPQTTCEAVDSAVNAAGNAVFADCRAAQAEYEAATNHGQAEGVLWPP